MKGLLLSLIFFLLVLQATTKGVNYSDLQLAKRNEVINVLLSKDYRKKTELISRINSSALLNHLKSSTTKFELDTIYTQSWIEETQMLTNSIRYNYDFEENGNRVNVKVYNWNSEENGWRIADNVHYDFNSEGMIIQAEFLHYITHLYITYTKVDYTYSGDLLANETLFKKADEEDEWEKIEQTEYSYNSDRLINTVYEKKWEDYDGIWLPQSKTEFEYNSFQNLIQEEGFDYEAYSMEWTQKSRTEYVYNDFNKIVEKTEYVVGFGNTQFIEDNKLTVTYDLFDEIETELLYSYDYDLDDWLPEVKIDHSANVPGKLYEKLGFKWNLVSEVWELEKRTDYLTIQHLNEEDILYWDFVTIHFPVYLFDAKVCEKIEEYTYLNDDWVNSGNIKYQFTSILQVGLNDEASTKVMVYPNPTVDFVYINTNNLNSTDYYVRDIHGRTVENSTFVSNAKLDLSYLTSGIYFLELRQKTNIIYSGKFCKY